jgi:RNA ligase (TIGR02306 family)
VAEIQAVRAHPNADRLEVAEILGWQVVVGKGTYQPGDRVIYVPPDAVVPEEWSDRWGVTKYLSRGRVRCAKLRGEPSFGFTATVADLSVGLGLEAWEVGDNVADQFGITKYEPPFRARADDAEPNHALFVKYTDIENLRHYPAILQPGEHVTATEKIHGANVRIGVVDGEVMAGSHRLRRKRPDDLSASLYWFPLSLPSVAAMLETLGAHHKQVILFGEVYGRVQSLHYGLEHGIDFRAFDLLVDGNYLDADQFTAACVLFGVPRVPVLYRGPFSLEAIKQHAEGTTQVGGEHYREGVVVKPATERHDPTIGRVVLKFVSDTYLTGGADEPIGDVDA